MQKIIGTALAGVMAATVFTAAPAFAQNRDRGDGSDWCKFENCDNGDRWYRDGDRGDRWDRDRDRDGWRFSRNRHWDDDCVGVIGTAIASMITTLPALSSASLPVRLLVA